MSLAAPGRPFLSRAPLTLHCHRKIRLCCATRPPSRRQRRRRGNSGAQLLPLPRNCCCWDQPQRFVHSEPPHRSHRRSHQFIIEWPPARSGRRYRAAAPFSPSFLPCPTDYNPRRRSIQLLIIVEMLRIPFKQYGQIMESLLLSLAFTCKFT